MQTHTLSDQDAGFKEGGSEGLRILRDGEEAISFPGGGQKAKKVRMIQGANAGATLPRESDWG